MPTWRAHHGNIGAPPPALTEWRDTFLGGGEVSMKSRESDVEDEEKRRLKSVVASLSVVNVLREKIAPGW